MESYCNLKLFIFYNKNFIRNIELVHLYVSRNDVRHFLPTSNKLKEYSKQTLKNCKICYIIKSNNQSENGFLSFKNGEDTA
jgi:hypothetical protein